MTLSELFTVFLRIGLLSFGGPAAQIALMHREIVDDRKWVDEKTYLSALSFCMLLPGPEAMQLATWIGWRLHGVRGGLIAGLLFVLPGACVVLALSMVYAAYGEIPFIAALFFGVKCAVVVVVIEALLRVSRRALKCRAQWVIAALAFVGLFAFNLPFPVIIGAAALWGFATSRGTYTPVPVAPGALRESLTAIVVWGAIWLIPLALLWQFEGGLLAEIGLFFSKLAMVTFGGAYAVLAWMSQEVVNDKDWLSLPQMIAGLGLAETTPGPLILVTEFVGYMAAWQKGGVLYGIAGAVVTLWMTFTPCFLWIFAGAPWIARLTSMPRLAGALSAITAAVVGVIANLSVWFAAHVFFTQVNWWNMGPFHLIAPDPATIQPAAIAIALLSGWLLLMRHVNLMAVLGIAAAAGAAFTLI